MIPLLIVIVLAIGLLSSDANAAVSFDVIGPKTITAMQTEMNKTKIAVERQFPLDLGNGNKVSAKFRLETDGIGKLFAGGITVVLIKPNSKGDLPAEPLQTKLVDLNKDGVKDLLIWGDIKDTAGNKQSVIAGFNFDAKSQQWKNSFATPELEYSTSRAQ